MHLHILQAKGIGNQTLAKTRAKATHTVDGRNPAPVDKDDIPLFTRFRSSQVVVWDFFHQQYEECLEAPIEDVPVNKSPIIGNVDLPDPRGPNHLLRMVMEPILLGNLT